MSTAQLLAQAAEADRKADGIFAAMRAASTAVRGRPLIPVGWEARAQTASDLRRKAERLRAQVAAESRPTTLSRTPVALISPSSPVPFAKSVMAARPGPKPDPVEDLVAQIEASASLARPNEQHRSGKT
jgi:hypothetical protein